MKKFKFSLDSVLSYKEQVLESLQGEHTAIMAEVREQEAVLEAAWQEYRDCDAEYTRRKAEGITITDAMVYQNGLRVLERNIQRETDKLGELRKKEEVKRQEVVDAKIDTSSIEKLKEKKLDLYNIDTSAINMGKCGNSEGKILSAVQIPYLLRKEVLAHGYFNSE